jgi:hypothetical protein
MTVQDFKAYVKKDFMRTDKDAQILDAYNAAIRAVSIQMPNCEYKYQSYIPTVIGQEDYSLPSSIIHLLHPVRILDGSASGDSGYPMDKLTKAEYDRLEPNPNRANPTTGKPYTYTVYGRQILLTRIPDSAAYLLEINWTKSPSDMTAESEYPLLPSTYDEVLKWMVLSRLNAGIELFDESQFWRNQYEDQMGEPVGIYRKLLDLEQSREGSAVTRVRVNSL